VRLYEGVFSGGERSVRFRAAGWRKRTFVHDADSGSYAPHNQTFDDVRLIPKAAICSCRREYPNLSGYRTAAVSDGLVQPSRSIPQRVWSLVSDHSPDDAVERLARSGIRDQFLAMMREKDLGQFC
jgi:hypothetical protein